MGILLSLMCIYGIIFIMFLIWKTFRAVCVAQGQILDIKWAWTWIMRPFNYPTVLLPSITAMQLFEDKNLFAL